MDSLINSFKNLLIDKEDSADFESLCNQMESMKLENEKPEEIKKIILNFFEILRQKKRCYDSNEITITKWVI